MKSFKECPFCSGIIVKKYTGIEDRLYTTKKTFSVSECTNCKAAHLNPMPTGDVSVYYPTNYLSGENVDIEMQNKKWDLEKWYRYNQYKFDFNLLTKATGLRVKGGSSYIDIGCGSGERVTYAREIGCKESYGVDKFDFAKNKSKREAKLISSEVLDFKPVKKFHIASLFHVLEHVENPNEILAHIRKEILSKNGKIIIQVPNYGSFERHLYRSKWYGFDVPRHVWQFNERALRKMVTDAGYKIDKVYQINAALHPVTSVPSLFRDLDVQRIWVNRKRGNLYKQAMTLLWAGLTLIAIPFNIIQNLFKKSSMLTIIASNK